MDFLNGLRLLARSFLLGPVGLFVDFDSEFAVEEVEGVFGIGLEVVVVGLADGDGLQAGFVFVEGVLNFVLFGLLAHAQQGYLHALHLELFLAVVIVQGFSPLLIRNMLAAKGVGQIGKSALLVLVGMALVVLKVKGQMLGVELAHIRLLFVFTWIGFRLPLRISFWERFFWKRWKSS